MKQHKILLGTLTSHHKDYCLDQWAKYVKSLTYPVDVLVLDNSEDEAHVKKITDLGLNAIHYRTERDTIQEIMCDCNNYIRDKVLKENYDFLFSLETDVFSAPNIIENLLLHRKPVVGVPYFIHKHYDSKLITFDVEEFGDFRLSGSMKPKQAFKYVDGTVKRAHQLGLGCILIHRSVLEMIEFRIEDDQTGSHPDSFFHQDCLAKGIPVYADTMEIATHINTATWLDIYKQQNK